MLQERPSPPRRSEDFYRDLMRETQPRQQRVAERERWLRGLKVEGREELLFEMEMLLRGVERYFNLHNLPIDAQPPLVTRDFREELLDVRDAMNEVIRIARRLADPSSDQKLMFRHYVETRLADDRVRRALLEEEVLGQATPQESLFLLRQGFESLRTVTDHLVRLEVCNFQLFNEVGTLVLREVLLNHFFCPFRPLEFRIEYDRVKSAEILDALAKLPPTARQLFTTAQLSLFRLLHYLSYVSQEADGPPVRRNRVILALVRSEWVSLVGWLEKALAETELPQPLRSAAVKVGRELAREGRKLARPERAAHAERRGESHATFEAAVAHTQLFRRNIVALAVAAGANMEPGEDPFYDLVSPLPASQRLQTDLWVFSELCRWTERSLREGKEAGSALRGLTEFIHTFHEVSYQLVRYADLEGLDRGCALFLEQKGVPEGPGGRERLADDAKELAQVTDAMFTSVSCRAELAGRRFDQAYAESVLGKYRPS